MSTVVVLQAAEVQLMDIYNRLDERSDGLGDKFEADFREACQLLERFPEKESGFTVECGECFCGNGVSACFM
jgi:hypothetical protein